ncbi:MAG: hypothetical protein IJ141_06030 [Lachnospiraceae bacterium]|nr:hypothetical protein [Lachnospiraceae bacterium]
MYRELLIDKKTQIDSLWKDEDEIWFVSRDENILYKYIISSKKKICIGKVNNSIVDRELFYRVHPKCIGYKSKIVCIPDNGRTFVFYDKFAYKFSYLELSMDYDVRIDIGNYWIKDNILWCVSCRINRIIGVDLENEIIVFDGTMFDNTDFIIGSGAFFYKDKIYIVEINSNTIAVFDTIKYNFEYIDINTNEEGYNAIGVLDEEIYLTGKEKNIYKYNCNNKSIEIIKFDQSSFSLYDDSANKINSGLSPIFQRVYKVGYYLVFLPWYYWDTTANSIVVLDTYNNKIKYYDIFKNISISHKRENNQYLFMSNAICDNIITVYIDGCSEKNINLSNDKIWSDSNYIEETVCMDSFFNTVNIVQENKEAKIKDYLKYIINS